MRKGDKKSVTEREQRGRGRQRRVNDAKETMKPNAVLI